MHSVNHLEKRVWQLIQLLKTSTVNDNTQRIIQYEAEHTATRLKHLLEIIEMDNISNKIIGGNEIIFPKVLEVRELAEQHYKEEDNEDE